MPAEVPMSMQKLNEELDKEFKLAPTPAQLGKAPLQRRQSMGKYLNRARNRLFDKRGLLATGGTLPNSEPAEYSPIVPMDDNGCNQGESSITSPSAKKSFFKKNKEDGMDK